MGVKSLRWGGTVSPTRAITFDNVVVPEHFRLGEGEGFSIAMKGLDGGRINIATCSIGTAHNKLLMRLCNTSKKESSLVKSWLTFKVLQFKLADTVTELVAARQMVRLAAVSKLDNKDSEATAYCAMAKRFATDVGFKICDQALQLYGGYGYIKEYPMERHFRDVRVHQILEGTNEIMRLIIARRKKQYQKALSYFNFRDRLQ